MQTTETSNKTLESQPQSNIAAISSPKELDIAQVVQDCARRKATIGETFSGRKGKQSLFALVCAAVKSYDGLGRLDKLPLEREEQVRNAVELFWKLQANKILNYGEVVSVVFDKPVIRFNDEMTVTEVKMQASMTARREPKDVSEQLLCLYHAKKQAVKRQDYMLENLAKYSRSDLQTQAARVTGIENKILELEASKVNASK